MVVGRGIKDRDLGLGWGYRPWGVGSYSIMAMPLSPPTDAVFAALLARNLVGQEPAAVLVQAGLCASRKLREGPHDCPLPLGSSRDPGLTPELVLDVVPAEKDLFLQLCQGLGPRSGVIDKLLHLAKRKKRATFTLLALQMCFNKTYLKSQ